MRKKPLNYPVKTLSSPLVTIMLNQSGNVLFLILIAVALFAALSFAITNSMRAPGNDGAVSSDQARINAAEIQQYLMTTRAAFNRLRVSGCNLNQISFQFDQDKDGDFTDNDAAELYHNPNAPSDLRCHVFHPKGGAVVHHKPLAKWLYPYGTAFLFYGELFITGFMRIGGIGDTSSRDLLLVIYGVDQKTCIEYNKSLSIDNPGGIPPVGRIYADTNGIFKGVMPAFGAGFATVPTDPLWGQASGCGLASPALNYNIWMVLQEF